MAPQLQFLYTLVSLFKPELFWLNQTNQTEFGLFDRRLNVLNEIFQSRLVIKIYFWLVLVKYSFWSQACQAISQEKECLWLGWLKHSLKIQTIDVACTNQKNTNFGVHLWLYLIVPYDSLVGEKSNENLQKKEFKIRDIFRLERVWQGPEYVSADGSGRRQLLK